MTGPQPSPLRVQTAQNVNDILEALGITDQVPFDLVNAVLPVINFERPDPTRAARSAFGGENQSAVAAQNSHFQLFNPATSGVILRPEAFVVALGSAGQISLRVHDTAVTNDQTEKTFSDRRQTGVPVGQVRIAGNAGLLGSAVGIYDAPATESIVIALGDDVVLAPGQGLLIAAVTVNVFLDDNVFWSEVTT